MDTNIIYNEGCFETFKRIDDKSIDLVLTDPPYGIKADKGVGGFGVSKTDKHYKGNWDANRPDKLCFDEMLRIGKNTLIFGGNFFANLLPVGTHWIVWDKKDDVKFQNPYSDCELIWTSFKKNTIKKYVFKQQGFITDSKDKRVHPTQKPTELIERIIMDYTNEGDTIFDPFMGSGTTAIACLNTKRNYIGCELDKGYYDICIKRIEEHNRRLL